MSRTAVFFLHALGMSGREWASVCAVLAPKFDCVPLDLPGFGDRAAMGACSVDALVDWTIAEIKERASPAWAIVGHSMGGKIASLVAARSQSGEAGLAGCLGVALVAASPPSPEPMDEGRRQHMIEVFKSGSIELKDAEAFIDANTAGALSGLSREVALNDVLRTSAAAWTEWLESGSREDRSTDVGQLLVPSLILAGSDDGDLGETAQRQLNLPHFPKAGQVGVIPQCAHLIPLEQPKAFAAVLERALDSWERRGLPPQMVGLLNSNRVGPAERARILARHHGPEQASFLEEADRATLRTLAQHVLGSSVDATDIANRVEVSIQNGQGDGWRFADLPEDAEVWPLALQTLERCCAGFAKSSWDIQAQVLLATAEGTLQVPAGAPLTGGQMKQWFEDARADLARIWASLPSTWAEMGYDGFAVGGSGVVLQGYGATSADGVEPWQLIRTHARED